jgi:hypothetical protein
MRFWKILESSQEEIGPVYPQIKGAEKVNGINTIGLIHEFQRENQYKKSSKNIEFPVLLLNRSSKFTDVLSQAILATPGFLISERLKSIILSYRTIDIEFIPVIVRKINSVEQRTYYWMHLASHVLDCVDFSNSEFFVLDNMKTKINGIRDLNDYNYKENFYRSQNVFAIIRTDKIALFESFASDLHILSISKIDFSVYVSDILKSHFCNNGVSGIEYQPANIVLS